MNFANTCKVISNKYGYFAHTSYSTSQVASEEVWVAQNNLIRKIYVMLDCWILWSNIWTRCSSYTRSPVISIGSNMMVRSEFGIYFLNWEMWNTLCTCSSSTGKSRRYGIQLFNDFIRPNISLTQFSLHSKPLDTLSLRIFQKNLWPTWNSRDFLLLA